jgi:Undecaprenyl-phosphate glucose phosphotransferase
MRGGFALVVGLFDFITIMSSAIAVGMFHHLDVQDAASRANSSFRLGFIVAMLFVVANAIRNEYAIGQYLSFKTQLLHSVSLWSVAFICTLGLAFVSETTGDLTASDFIDDKAASFFILGFLALCLERYVLVHCVRWQAKSGGFAARRVFLIGYEDEVEAFSRRFTPDNLDMNVVAASHLRGPESLGEDLALASASARILRPDDIFILVPWSQRETIDTCINAFLRVPASIHLGPERVLDRFADARISKIGAVSSLNLVRHPMTPTETLTKRVFDIAIAGTALLLLTPILAALALAIKLDSKGPIIFRQRRYGFNQEMFRIFKFRSMTTLEDDFKLKQASENDDRVTRLGRLMRRYNLDELPQLWNVVRGDMSLVGPRPHALVHDQIYDRTIGLYARRHNVKPGITGWAQVNGHRGGITEAGMRARVEHDLYYIDHWSLWLDIRILFFTLVSRKAYSNAY